MQREFLLLPQPSPGSWGPKGAGWDVFAGCTDREGCDTAAPCTSSAEGKTRFVFEVGEDRSTELVCQGRNSSDLFRTVQKIPMPLPETLNL